MGKLFNRQKEYLTKEQIEKIDEINKEALEKMPLSYRGMVQIPHFITRSRGLVTSQAFHLYSILKSYAYQAYTCYPTQEQLRKDMGVKTKTTVIKYLKELENLGLIETIKVKNPNNGFANNVYILKPFKHTLLYKNMYAMLTSEEIEVIENEDTSIHEEVTNQINDLLGIGDIDSTEVEYATSTRKESTASAHMESTASAHMESHDSTNLRFNNNQTNKNQSVRIKKESLSNDKGILPNTVVRNKLFDTSSNEITHLEKKLNKLDKNKNRLECAKLRFKIASLKNDWSEVTGRDAAYYFKNVLYKEKYGLPMKTDKYFNSDMNKFLTKFDIPKDEYLDVLKYLLDEYEYFKDENYPRVSQKMFRQEWLLDKVMLGYVAQKEQKVKKAKLEEDLKKSEKIREEYIATELAEGREPRFVF